MYYQRGIVHLLLLVVFLIVIVLGAVFFLKLPVKLPNLSNTSKKEPTISVKTEYKNPFKKESQYVNPFDSYKSPFLTFEQK